MTKLIDSLCGVNRLKGRNRVQDSYNDVSPEKVAKAKEFIKEEADRPEDALYVVMDYLYEAPVAIDTDRDILDVESKGHYWPNEDAYRSSIVKVNEPGVAMTSLWGTGNPRDLWFIPVPVAEICEIDDPKVTPGYYYLDGETNTIERIGETSEDLDKWVASLDTDETIEARKREFARKEQLGRDERRMSAETSRENVEDSSEEDSKRQSAMEELNKLRKSIPDSKIVESLPRVSSSEDLFDFIDRLRSYFSVDKISDSVVKFRITPNDSDAVRKLFSEANIPLKESNDWLFSAEAPKDRVVELLQDYEYEIEDSASKVSDAAYNPKFEKLRKVISDTTIVEELSHYMSSDELEEFTETLTRNYDIDLEEVEDSSK